MEVNMQFLQTMAGIYLLAGIINCFLGYRILKIIVGFWGFVLGFSLTLLIFSQIQGATPMVSTIAGIVGGIIGIVLVSSLIKVGIFGVGAFFGYLIGMNFASLGGAQPNVMILVLAAIIGGLLALVMQKPMLILATAFGGSWLIVRAFAVFKGIDFHIMDMIQQPILLKTRDTQFYILFSAWIVIGLFGAAMQFKLTGKHED